jgi:hypothetical protein
MKPVEEDKTSGRESPPCPYPLPLLEEKRETWGKCSISSFSGTAASSRMGVPTPNPFLYLGDFCTHTHRSGAYGRK